PRRRANGVDCRGRDADRAHGFLLCLFGVAFAFGARPGATNAKLRTELIFEFEHLSRTIRNRAAESSDTLEQIFPITAFLGYGFDNHTPPRATDIRRAAP